MMISSFCVFFFFNDTATTEIYTLSLHDALPIFLPRPGAPRRPIRPNPAPRADPRADRKSTRLNSSHVKISYAVFCLKKKNHWAAAANDWLLNKNAADILNKSFETLKGLLANDALSSFFF